MNHIISGNNEANTNNDHFFSFLEPRNTHAALGRCIQTLKMIPSLSQEQRMDWNHWYKLHETALCMYNFHIPFFNYNFKLQLPWFPMQVRADFIYTDDCLRTSCGVTNHIALTKLLGAKDAAWFLVCGKENRIEDLQPALENPKPSLFAFEFKPCDLVSEDGLKAEYLGHIWTVFKANSDRYLMITSYLHRQNAVVMELDGKEMRAHITDMQTISNADKWTKQVDDIYIKWFGVSHGELIGLNPTQTEVKRPWQMTFISTQPDLCNVNHIQEQFTKALQLFYFPEGRVIKRGDKIPIDDVKVQKAFDQGSTWWCSRIVYISLKSAISEYFSFIF